MEMDIIWERNCLKMRLKNSIDFEQIPSIAYIKEI